MREIKFRAKSKGNTKKWVYGTGIVPVKNNTYDTDEYEMIQGVNYDELDYYIPDYEAEEININTIGQYTGFKDKNGVDIYEGDIVELDEDARFLFGSKENPTRKYQLVAFSSGAFMTGRNRIDYQIMNTYLWILKDYTTVVGNKFDNIELLEKEGE